VLEVDKNRAKMLRATVSPAAAVPSES
jgi:hypothetical protein